MSQEPNTTLNRAKPYQLMLFPLNNGATNVYFVLILSYVAQFGSSILKLGMFASIMVTVMRVADAVTDPIIGAMMDRTSTKIGKFRPFMILGSAVMAVSVVCLYILTPLIPETVMWARYAAFVVVYFVWVIGYTRAGQTVLTNDPNQRPMFTIFNTVGSLLGMGVMQFMIPLVKGMYDVKDAAGNVITSGYADPMVYRIITPIGIAISVFLTILAIIGIAEKDNPKYYGIGGEKQEKVKLSEYVEIIKNNKPMQRLMVAGAGCKLALAIATNTTVLLALYGILMGNYNSLYLPMMVLGYVCAVPFFLLSMRTSQKLGQRASLVRYVSVALVCYVGVLALMLFSDNGTPALMLSFPFNGGGAINLYTILFIAFFGIGYGAYRRYAHPQGGRLLRLRDLPLRQVHTGHHGHPVLPGGQAGVLLGPDAGGVYFPDLRGSARAAGRWHALLRRHQGGGDRDVLHYPHAGLDCHPYRYEGLCSHGREDEDHPGGECRPEGGRGPGHGPGAGHGIYHRRNSGQKMKMSLG